MSNSPVAIFKMPFISTSSLPSFGFQTELVNFRGSPVSTSNTSLLKEIPNSNTEIETFGLNIFKDSPTTFAPVDLAPAPLDYVIGPGDELRIQLFGTEIKSIRNNKASIAEAYAVMVKNELFIRNMYIANYENGGHFNHESKRDRKLLLNKREINKLIGKMQRDGFTIIPTKMYFKKGKAKVELAVAKGKKKYDKRLAKKNRDWNRDKARYVRKSS